MKLLKEWSVYMARCVDGSLYTGIAKDVRARLTAHNSGRGAAYTRSRRPVRLVHVEEGFTRSKALSREARIKSLERPEKLSLLRSARAARRALAVLAVVLCAGLARATPVFDKEENFPAAWSPGFTTLFSSAAPQAFTFLGGATPFYPIRMYFIRQSTAAEVDSATSPDGLAWTEESYNGHLSTNTVPTVNASSITGCGVLPITGGFRMVYSIISSTGSYRIHSATSTDGFHWGNDTGSVVDNGQTFLTDPKLVLLNDNVTWRMYYVANTNLNGTDIGHRQIFSVSSVNQGRNWSTPPSLVLSTMAFDVGASLLTNGKVRLYFTEPVAGSTVATTVLSALSTNILANSFNVENGPAIVSTAASSGSLSYPVPVRSTDTFRWRLYYDFVGPGVVGDFIGSGAISTADVHSALTGPPEPVSVLPSSVINSQAAATITINGDVFSPGATVMFNSGGLTLVPTGGFSTANDQTLTANYDVQSLAPGPWSLTVTNADGNSTTLPNALNITFPPGSATLVNNLLRPRTGTSTAITITTFNIGRVTAKLFTIDGRSVRTLFDADNVPPGVLDLSWDGRDGGGTPVASGLYILHVTGQLLDARLKIIVIR